MKEKMKPVSPNRLQFAKGHGPEKHALAMAADDYYSRKTDVKKFPTKPLSSASTGNKQTGSIKPVFGKRKP